MTTDPLSRARAALEAGDRPSALEQLLAAWRASRSAAIAELVELLSTEIDRSLPAIEGKTRKAFQERWLDVADQGRAVDVGRLLAGLRREPCGQIAERIERLAMRPPDPRFATALGALAADCPCTSSPNRPMWTRVFQILGQLADPRLEVVLRPKLKSQPNRLASFDELLYPRLERLLAALPTPPAPSAEVTRLLARLRVLVEALLAGPPAAAEELQTPAVSAPSTEADLLRLITDAPDDDAPRLVYADWLLERGDPRGELITLQFKKRDQGLTGQEAHQERMLLKQHGRSWLGALEPIIEREGVELRRGFLSACRVRFRTARQRQSLIEHPLWATVERATADVALLLSPAMRSLRVVEEVSPEEALQLATHERPLPFDELGVDATDDLTPPQRAAIAAAASLPRLTRLRLELPSDDIFPDDAPVIGPEELRWLLDGPLGARLELLHLRGRGPYVDLAAWLSAAERLPALQRLVLELVLHWRFELSRGGGGWELSLRWGETFTTSSLVTAVPRALERLPVEVITALRVELPRLGQRSRAQLAPDLRAAVGRFGAASFDPPI